MLNNSDLEKLKKFIDLKPMAHVATVLKDGSPHFAPTWIDYDKNFILINTFVGSQKDKNLLRNPNVAISMEDPNNKVSVIIMKGKVLSRSEKEGNEHINLVAFKYTGSNKYEGPNTQRVLYKITPEKLLGFKGRSR